MPKMTDGTFTYSAKDLNWEPWPEDRESLRDRLVREMVQMRPERPERPVAYCWEASLPIPWGGTKIVGSLVDEDGQSSQEAVRRLAFQKFKRHVELEVASPGTLSCYHVARNGKRTHVGYFHSRGNKTGTNIHMPTAMGDLEQSVAVFIRPDRAKQAELDAVEPRPRGYSADLAIYDEVPPVEPSSQDVAYLGCASGCLCPLEGVDVALTGTEVEL